MRVSLEEQGKSQASSKGKSHGSGHSKGHGGKDPMSQAQKVKAGVAVVVIVLAGVWIAYSQNLFGGGQRVEKFPDPTPEQLEQMNQEMQKQAQQQGEQHQSGSSRVAPLGAQ